MSDLSEMYQGIAVVIDDEIDDAKANINDLMRQIREQHYPILPFKELPDSKVYKNFRNLAFIVLDWRLNNPIIRDSESGTVISIPISDDLQQDYVDKHCTFISEILNVCFCPIFIFTNERVDKVIGNLKAKELYFDDKPNHIFVHSKGGLKIFDSIYKWIKENPSMYVLKEWENEYHKSKNQLFLDFNRLTPYWPQIMWENYDADKVSPSRSLGDMVSRNLISRMAPYNFDLSKLSIPPNYNQLVKDDELMAVLQGEIFLQADKLGSEHIMPGDLFKRKSNKYYLNIRAACDLVPRDKPLDECKLYLIKGEAVKVDKLRELYNQHTGSFNEQHSYTLIFPYNGSAIRFNFNELEVKSWNELKDIRVERVLSPYINKIIQKYTAYSQRQGLPRLPKKLFPELEPIPFEELKQADTLYPDVS